MSLNVNLGLTLKSRLLFILLNEEVGDSEEEEKIESGKADVKGMVTGTSGISLGRHLAVSP